MYYGKGIMNIQIENSIKDTPKVRNGIYLTTKSRKEGHGIGLQNVKLVVENIMVRWRSAIRRNPFK